MQAPVSNPTERMEFQSFPASTTPSGSMFDKRVVLILVGLIGSGKSTFAQALEHHFPQFRRCSQDELGDRRQVERLARQTLSEGLSVCIDRTNVDETQRSHWINIALEFPQTAIWVLVFDTPYQICVERLRERIHHPTIKSPEHALEVLARFSSSYRPPLPHEGHDRIMHINPSDHPSSDWTHADVIAVLQRLHDSQPVVSRSRSQPRPQFRGKRGPSFNRGRPYRGYSRGYGSGTQRGHTRYSSNGSNQGVGEGPGHSTGHPAASQPPWNFHTTVGMAAQGLSGSRSSRPAAESWRRGSATVQGEEGAVLDLTRSPESGTFGDERTMQSRG